MVYLTVSELAYLVQNCYCRHVSKQLPIWGKYWLAGLLTLLYNDWVFETAFNPHISPKHSLISELSALSQPYHWIFQTLDISAGLLTLAFVIVVWRLTVGLSTRSRLLLAGLFAFVGIDSIVDASLPVACAPSMDPQCRVWATHALLTTAHGIESNIAGCAIVLLPVAWWWQYRGKHTIIAQISFWFTIMQIIIGMGALAVRLSGRDTYGILQRIYESGLGIWMGSIGGVAAMRQQLVEVAASQPSKSSTIQETEDMPLLSTE